MPVQVLAPVEGRRRRGLLLWLGSLVVGLSAFFLAWDMDYVLLRTRNYSLVNAQGNVFDQGVSHFAHSRAAADARLPVVVCPISDQTHQEFEAPRDDVLPELKGRRLTFRSHARAFHARVLRNLHRLGARVVAFDLLFDEPDAMDPYLARAIREHRRVLVAVIDVKRVLASGLAEQTLHLQYPTPELRAAAAGMAAVNVTLDKDRGVRRFRWSFTGIDPDTVEDTRIPALGPAAAALFEDRDPLRALDEEFLSGGTFLGKRVEWLADRRGRERYRFSYIRYFGESGAPAGPGSVVPYEEVFAAFDPATPRADRERLKAQVAGKIVLIGDETTTGQDWHRVPVISTAQVLDDNQQMSGVEIQAAVAETALSGRYFRQAPEIARFLLVLCASVACALVGRLLSPIPFLLLAALGLGALLASSVWLLAGPGVWIEPVTASVGLVLSLIGETILMFLGERKTRLKVRRQLSRHVGPGVAERLAEGEWPDFGGETREITLLFSDLQGFTSLSESLSSGEICDLLNRYLGVIFPVVDRHGGVLDKLMGDGMMAYFGWPQRQPDHAAKAVRCAVEMQEALAAWQASPEMAGQPPLRTRIGIHTGEATIGEIGYRDRAEFTVIGDVVNVASRLEGLNKEYGTTILLSEATRSAAGEVAPTHFRGEVAVRGRREPTPVYSVDAQESVPVPSAKAATPPEPAPATSGIPSP